MRRLALLAACLLLVIVPTARAEEGEPGAERVAWFTNLSLAREAATKTGRPIFVAMHVRPYIASPEASQRMEAWTEAYRDPRFVALSRRCACVLRVISAPEGRDPDVDAAAVSASHLLVDGTSRVLVRKDGDAEAVGGVGGLIRLLRAGLRAFGPIAADAPLIDEQHVRRTKKQIQGLGPMNPIGVPVDAPGVRVRLRWELPTPQLGEADTEEILADVQMRWDGEGPWDLQSVAFGAGEEIDLPIDIRFAEHEGLAELATEGTHRVDLYLVPKEGSYPFSTGPLHVGRVWIDLGEGGGGGGGGSDEQESEKPQEEQPEPPQPIPEGDEEREPDPPPPSGREEVVKAFQNEGEEVEKEDAVVAVEDPNGGVEPPKRLPIQEALREFEKQAEKEIRREGISPRDRDYFRTYFESFVKEARKRAPPPKQPPGQQPPAKDAPPKPGDGK